MSFALPILSSLDREAYGFPWDRKGIAWACPSLYPTTEIYRILPEPWSFVRDGIEAWGIAPRWRPFSHHGDPPRIPDLQFGFQETESAGSDGMCTKKPPPTQSSRANLGEREILGPVLQQ